MKVFLTGATGYIGAAIGEQLMAAGHELAGLTRSEAGAAKLEGRGATAVIGGLDEPEILAKAARDADAVIHAANADHRPSAEALLAALAGSGKPYIHTSGAGIVADMAGGEERAPVYDETTPVHPLPARVPRVALNDDIRARAKDGVRAIVIAPPMVYGRGGSIQIPKMIAVAREHGAGLHVGAGSNRWSAVHVEDLALLFLLALEKAPAGAFYYADNGEENSMRGIAAGISRMVGRDGKTRALTIDEAYAIYGEGPVNLSFGSNCRVRAARARAELGWSNTRPLLLDEIERGSYAKA